MTFDLWSGFKTPVTNTTSISYHIIYHMLNLQHMLNLSKSKKPQEHNCAIQQWSYLPSKSPVRPTHPGNLFSIPSDSTSSCRAQMAGGLQPDIIILRCLDNKHFVLYCDWLFHQLIVICYVLSSTPFMLGQLISVMGNTTVQAWWGESFLSDSGKPGVPSLGPNVLCDSSLWRYQLNTNW